MGQTTNIEWTDRTWNPTRGCSIVSPGCVNCYAMKQAHRFSGPSGTYEGLTKLTSAGPQWTGKVVTVEDKLLEPLSWRTPSRVFVDSMSDLFHKDVPDAYIVRAFAVMALAPRHRSATVLAARPAGGVGHRRK
jgi:protein gp37